MAAIKPKALDRMLCHPPSKYWIEGVKRKNRNGANSVKGSKYPAKIKLCAPACQGTVCVKGWNQSAKRLSSDVSGEASAKSEALAKDDWSFAGLRHTVVPRAPNRGAPLSLHGEKPILEPVLRETEDPPHKSHELSGHRPWSIEGPLLEPGNR